jgi:biopolymer transport protein ExbD
MASVIETKGKSAPRIDMTPMVDLGFLLITFFVMTTTLSKQRTLEMNMPDTSSPPSMVLKDSRVLNVVVGKDNFTTYFGTDTDIKQQHKNSEELRTCLIQHKNSVNDKISHGQLLADDIAFLIVKPTLKSTVADLVQVLDELSINEIQSYSIVDADSVDEKMVR